ncbi:Uncharacterized membrane protein PA1577 [Sideroxydans sp. CL21]|nr:Uncharacterized membrane protein PA1577 [Sideroxydans sp. CL21]
MNLISNPLLVTALMLAVSNLFMTFPRYMERNTCRVSQNG